MEQKSLNIIHDLENISFLHVFNIMFLLLRLQVRIYLFDFLLSDKLIRTGTSFLTAFFISNNDIGFFLLAAYGTN